MKNLNWIANLHRNNFQMKYRNLWEKQGPRLRRKLLGEKVSACQKNQQLKLLLEETNARAGQ